MPEPIEAPATDLTAELATLRQAHSEVLTKRAKDKAKIAELETASSELQAKLTAAENAVHAAVVGVPLQQMAESISTVPTLWLETFHKHFKVEHKDGKLTVLTLDGKPLANSKGETVPFVQSDIAKYLTETEPESERTKLFQVMTITSRASGAAGIARHTPSRASQTASLNFGLR